MEKLTFKSLMRKLTTIKARSLTHPVSVVNFPPAVGIDQHGAG
ncbi:hypothetical protein OAG51_03215 [Pirellulaceae bacterium]|nr:hypothetical protein [Pirellulaceae bacterium]